MVESNLLPNRGFLRVVPPAQHEENLREEAKQRAALDVEQQPDMTDMAAHIRTQFDIFRDHRNSQAGWSERMLYALRSFNGQYDAQKLAEIQRFGGSQVYARVIAMKCRGASSLLRDVYLAADRAWGIAPPADPDVPVEIAAKVKQLVDMEISTLAQQGVNVPPEAIRDRMRQLLEGARTAEKAQAKKRAKISEEKIEEILNEGGAYKALAEFITDLPLFPFACIKGPIVRIVPTVDWSTGEATISQKPRLFWSRVSPFDLFWTPGVSDIEDATVIERQRLTRAELNDLLDLPGYHHENIRKVLDEYSSGIFDNFDSTDTERAVHEHRENPHTNRSGLITCLEFHGCVQGKMLRQYGFGPERVPDELRDYMVQAWLIGRYIIKVQLSPSPRQRHPYFVTSFEKVPGTPVGNGLPDILSDIQEVCNAALRSLVNNLSIASGPQVVVNVDRLAPHEDGEELFPWKRWHVEADPMGNNTQDPISFFQPKSNAQELLGVYKEFNNIADELSAIPKYLSGQGASGGAGRTAAGLAMLMGNASKILQTVAANIDRDVMEPMLEGLFDMIMLTDRSGLLKGDEAVRVMGVNVAVQRETQRSRQLEFLQITANPLDAQIVGPRGRAAVLRSVAKTIGLDGESVVPSDDEVVSAVQQQGAQDVKENGAKAQGTQQGGGVTGDMGPRVNIAGKTG